MIRERESGVEKLEGHLQHDELLHVELAIQVDLRMLELPIIERIVGSSVCRASWRKLW